MANLAVKLSRADKTVKAILGAAGVGYKGRKIGGVVAENVTYSNLNWTEGTRTYYYAVNLSDLRAVAAKVEAPWQEKHEGMRRPIPLGFAIVEHHFFGTAEWVTIKINPADAARVLPAGVVARAS
jgi:hypothetical protein